MNGVPSARPLPFIRRAGAPLRSQAIHPMGWVKKFRVVNFVGIPKPRHTLFRCLSIAPHPVVIQVLLAAVPLIAIHPAAVEAGAEVVQVVAARAAAGKIKS